MKRRWQPEGGDRCWLCTKSPGRDDQSIWASVRWEPAMGARPMAGWENWGWRGGRWLDKQDSQGFLQHQRSVRPWVRTRACGLPVASPEPFFLRDLENAQLHTTLSALPSSGPPCFFLGFSLGGEPTLFTLNFCPPYSSFLFLSLMTALPSANYFS